MSADNPYGAPEASAESPGAPPGPLRLWRIPLWGAVMFSLVVAIHVLGFFAVKVSSPAPDNFRTAMILMNLVANLVASLVVFILYILFLRRTARRPFLQVLAVFLLLQLMTIPLALFWFGAVEDLMSVWSLAWNLAICLAAYATWRRFLRKPHQLA